MRAGRVFALGLCTCSLGCAAIIGASFGDATPATDASDAAGFSDLGLSFDGGIDPRSVTGLGLWLDATEKLDVFADGGVSRWHDLSGNARDAVPVGAAYEIPTVTYGINGRPTVHFNASDWQLLITPWSGPGGNGLTIFVVEMGYPQSAVRFQSNSSQGPLVVFPFDVNAVNGDDGGPVFGLLVSNESFARLDFTSNQPHLLGARFDYGVTYTYLDGKLVEQRLPGNTTLPTGQTLYIGGDLPLLSAPYTQSQFFDGDLGEILIYEASLTDSERAAVESYLREKWTL